MSGGVCVAGPGVQGGQQQQKPCVPHRSPVVPPIPFPGVGPALPHGRSGVGTRAPPYPLLPAACKGLDPPQGKATGGFFCYVLFSVRCTRI